MFIQTQNTKKTNGILSGRLPKAQLQVQVPPLQHLAIIMDGNRRWARAKGLGAINGHEHVVNNVIEPIVDRCIELGIPYLTVWAFSTETWHRDKMEVEGLIRVFRHAFTSKRVEDLHKKGVRLCILGEIDKFPKDVAENAKKWAKISKKNTKITVNFALNYGGRDEIIRAVKKLVLEAKENPKKIVTELTEATFGRYLDTAGVPDPDLVIRTSGEQRLSGFLAWQSTYSELYFTKTLMPDFTVDELNIALEEYTRRKRRFGK